MLEQNDNKIIFNMDKLTNCKEIVFNIDEIIKNNPHYKGYIYDSLVYRYMRAREKMADYEYLLDKTRDRSFYQHCAQSDIMRFCEILNEAIGEHN